MDRSIIENLAQLNTQGRVFALRSAVSVYLDTGKPELVHRLLWEEAVDGWGNPTNAWYHAWEIYWKADRELYKQSEGFTEEYLRGVGAAWDAAETAWIGAQTAEERSQIVGLVARYALITGSVRGLGRSTDPSMIRLLLAVKMWPPVQVINFISQITDVQQRLNLLDAIGDDLRGVIPYEKIVLETLQCISEPETLAVWLRRLARHLSTSDTKCIAVTLTKDMSTSYSRTDWGAHALEGMAHCLKEHLENEDRALDLIFDWHGSEPYRMLRAVVPHLPPPLAKGLIEAGSLREMSLSVDEEQGLLAQLLIRIANGNEMETGDADGRTEENQSRTRAGDPEWALRHMATRCYTEAQAATLSVILSTSTLTDEQRRVAEAELSRVKQHLVRRAWLDRAHEVSGSPGIYPLSETPIAGAEEVFRFVEPDGGPCISSMDMLSLYLPILPEIAFSQAINWLFEQWNEEDDRWIWRQLANSLSGQQRHRLFALLIAQLERRSSAGIARSLGQSRCLQEIIADIPESLCDDVLRLIERLLRSVLNETRYLFIDEKRDEVGEIFTSLIVPLVRRFGDRLIPATLDLVGLIEDDLTRLTGLAALAFGLPDDVFGEALALLKRLEGHATESDDEGVLLSALAIIAAQLARHARDESNLLDLYDRALRMATDVPDSKRRALTLLRLGGLLEDLLRQDALPEAQVRELVQAAQRYARYQNDRPRLVLTLAILFPWLSHSTQEQARDSLLAAVNREYPKRRQNSLMGKAAQEERESILRRINSNPNPVMVSAETDNRTEMDALFSRWALQIRQIAESTRPALLAALPTMLTDIERLGGKTAVEEVYRAVEKAGRWWPQQVDAQNGDDQSEPDQTPQIGTRVFDDKEALIGYVDDLGVVYNTVGQTVGRIAQETVITPHGPYPYEVKVQVLNSQDEPVAYMANPRGDADSMHDVSGLYLGETFLEGTAFLPNDITVVVSANGQRLGYVEGDMPGHAIGAKVLLHHLLP